MKLPKRYILTISPKEYLVQGLSHCGAYSVKAILSAFGKDTSTHPSEYHTNLLSKKLGGGLGKQYWVNILRSYGLKAQVKTANNMTNDEKLVLLKQLLYKNTPVMIRIGNGYYKSKRHNFLLSKLVNHWITLWGYDDDKEIFYVYDSAMPSYLYDEIPIGNVTRTYSEILRDWNFGRWQPLYWYISWDPFLYISVSS